MTYIRFPGQPPVVPGGLPIGLPGTPGGPFLPRPRGPRPEPQPIPEPIPPEPPAPDPIVPLGPRNPRPQPPPGPPREGEPPDPITGEPPIDPPPDPPILPPPTDRPPSAGPPVNDRGNMGGGWAGGGGGGVLSVRSRLSGRPDRGTAAQGRPAFDWAYLGAALLVGWWVLRRRTS